MKENNYKCFDQIFQLVHQYEELKYVELKKNALSWEQIK